MKRWMALVAAVLMQNCLGVVYAWSTFVPALKSEYGVNEGAAGLSFGICIAVFTVVMLAGGNLQQKYGPRRIGVLAGLLFLAGYWTGARSGGNLTLLLAGPGFLAGAGIGLGYVCPLATGIKWFPHHKGLVTGLITAGFGLGSVFFARIGLHLLEAGFGVLEVFQRIALVAGGLIMLSSLFLFTPPHSNAPLESGSGLLLRQVLRSRHFLFLFSAIFCGTFGGLVIIGNLKPLGISIGLNSGQATAAVMLFAITNAAGRILWGLFYDWRGSRVITLCMLLFLIGAAGMTLFQSGPAFYPSVAVIAFAFGGCFVLFAARVVDLFGAWRFSEIYPFVFLGYGIAGLVGAPVGGWLLHFSGGPALPAFAVMGAGLIAAGIVWTDRRYHDALEIPAA